MLWIPVPFPEASAETQLLSAAVFRILVPEPFQALVSAVLGNGMILPRVPVPGPDPRNSRVSILIHI